MEWMLNNQDARRNLTAVDRLLAAEKLREKIAEEARLKKEEALSKFQGNQHKNVVCYPIGYDTKNDEKLVTQKEIAKIAGVATGTVARFDKIMKSGDEELKEKVKSGKMTINAGYKAVKEKEKGHFSPLGHNQL